MSGQAEAVNLFEKDHQIPENIPIPRFRGALLCRRCDECGCRMVLGGGEADYFFLLCPQCEEEKIFSTVRSDR